MKILDTASIQKWEKDTIASGVPASRLMEQAVHGLHEFISSRFPAGRALVACGKGNNGNDARWLASALSDSGWDVAVWSSHPDDEWTAVDSEPVPIRFSKAKTILFPECPDACFSTHSPLLIIDGLLGLGADGAPRGTPAEMIRWLMQHKRPQDVTLSLDIPSGVDGNTGENFDPVFHADFTVAIGAVKSGSCTEEALPAVGRLSAVPISLNLPGPVTDAEFFTLEDARSILRSRTADTYKHRQGVVHLWAGSPGMAGAALLASQSALRSGAGLVRLFTTKALAENIPLSCPEIMTAPIQISGELNSKVFDCDALLVGPGIGLSQGALALFEEIISKYRSGLVIDADGLTLAADEGILSANIPQDTVLTPHFGEFSRMFPEKTSLRSHNAQKFVSLHPQLTLALKGPNTLVANHAGGLSYNGSGNPGMATAGSGDVLAGLIAGLRAQDYSPWDAARLGVFWHGMAGDIAAQTLSEDSLTAGDIINCLGPARVIISRP